MSNRDRHASLNLVCFEWPDELRALLLPWVRTALRLAPRRAGGSGQALVLAVMAAGLCAPIDPATAADLDGSCCADLEERIAELESTAARKGNRKVSLTVAGQVNKAILAWDDGAESNVYVVGNKNDQTSFFFAGQAQVQNGVTAGYELIVRVRDDLSDAANQDRATGDSGFDVWQAHWWVDSESMGKVSLGLASRVTDTAPETDVSETGVAGYAGVQDVAGGFALRRKDGALASLAWGDFGNHMNGDTANLVRYDSPAFAGFVVSASWGEDDVWDTGIRYSYAASGVMVEAVIAYAELTGDDGAGGRVDESTLVGSASILHEATGLNATLAAGSHAVDANVVDVDGVARRPEDARFAYVKLGWLAKLVDLGPTALYGEYGRFDDFLTAGAGQDVVASLAEGPQGCAAAGAACRIASSALDVWGVGAVQHIEAADMQIYLAYRRYEADIGLADGAGAAASAADLDVLQTVVAGSKIAF